jgi:DHA2 family multidrug resistance protein-like MFS transporter
MALTALLFALFSWAGIFLFVGQYLQLVLGMDPFKAGLWTMPSAAGSIVTCMLAPLAVRRIRRGFLMAIGLGILATGLVMLTQVDGVSGLPLLITATICMSAGCGLTVTLGSDMVIASAPPERAGAAAGIYETSTTLGSALGIAILGSIGTAVYRSGMADVVTNNAARSTLGGALAVAKQLHGPSGIALLRHARGVFAQSFRLTTGICAVIIIVIAVLVAVMLRHVRPGVR